MRFFLLAGAASAHDINLNLIPASSGAALSGFLKKQSTQATRDVADFEASLDRVISGRSHSFAELATDQFMIPYMAKMKERLMAGGQYTKTAVDRLSELAKISEFRAAMKKNGIADAALSAMKRESGSAEIKGAAGSLAATLLGGVTWSQVMDPATGGNGHTTVVIQHPSASLSEKSSGPYDRTTQAPYVWVNRGSLMESSSFSTLDLFVENGAGAVNFGQSFKSSLSPLAKRTNLLRSRKSFAQLKDGISGPLTAIAAEMANTVGAHDNSGLIQQLVNEAKADIASSRVNAGVSNAEGARFNKRTQGGLLTMEGGNVPNTDEVKNRLTTTGRVGSSAIAINIFDQ